MKKIKSIEGVKFGQVLEPWNSEKRYQKPVIKYPNNDMPNYVKKKPTKKKRNQNATFNNSIIGQNLQSEHSEQLVPK